MGANGERFSNDLDFFYNAADAANQTFAADALALRAAGYEVTILAPRGSSGNSTPMPAPASSRSCPAIGRSCTSPTVVR